METPGHSNTMGNITGWILSGIFFFFSRITAEDFRSWTFWGLSVILLVLNIFNHPKVKNFFKRK